MVLHEDQLTTWWTWAGGRANAVLHAALNSVAPRHCDPDSSFTNDHIALDPEATAEDVRRALVVARSSFGADLRGVEPEITRRAVQDLKFGDLLPEDMAVRTLASRLADHEGAWKVAETTMVERRVLPS